MCYTVRTENILSWLLLKNEKGVSISTVRKCSKLIQNNLSDCFFDVSDNSIYAVVEGTDMFMWENDLIIFSNGLNKENIKSNLYYILPNKINLAFEKCDFNTKEVRGNYCGYSYK